uniref:Uncharacterized protein n=1 Tax=Marmota marmota marmota TaxID=9994 RepID=A0A8C5ZDM2_MARMA
MGTLKKMIRTVKPKNARAKRALVKREAKLVENVKQALFIPGQIYHDTVHRVIAVSLYYRFFQKILIFNDP